jgi:hypothetical protein
LPQGVSAAVRAVIGAVWQVVVAFISGPLSVLNSGFPSFLTPP